MCSNKAGSTAGRVDVDLTGAPQTMLATLYAKALDAHSSPSVLHDQWAALAVARIDHDWRATSITRANSGSVTQRSLHFDRWAAEFLDAHERATVLHLGCGLDSRCYRLDPGAGVEWYDIDYPEVIALREKVYPERAHHHHIATSVVDPAWLARIPTGLPVLVVAEGLTMYLTEAEGLKLLRGVVRHFGTGEIQFDAFNSVGIKSQKLNAVVRRSGSTLHWGIDGSDDLLARVPELRVRDAISVFDSAAFQECASPGIRLLGRAMRTVRPLRMMAQYHRYTF